MRILDLDPGGQDRGLCPSVNAFLSRFPHWNPRGSFKLPHPPCEFPGADGDSLGKAGWDAGSVSSAPKAYLRERGKLFVGYQEQELLGSTRRTLRAAEQTLPGSFQAHLGHSGADWGPLIQEEPCPQSRAESITKRPQHPPSAPTVSHMLTHSSPCPPQGASLAPWLPMYRLESKLRDPAYQALTSSPALPHPAPGSALGLHQTACRPSPKPALFPPEALPPLHRQPRRPGCTHTSKRSHNTPSASPTVSELWTQGRAVTWCAHPPWPSRAQAQEVSGGWMWGMTDCKPRLTSRPANWFLLCLWLPSQMAVSHSPLASVRLQTLVDGKGSGPWDPPAFRAFTQSSWAQGKFQVHPGPHPFPGTARSEILPPLPSTPNPGLERLQADLGAGQRRGWNCRAGNEGTCPWKIPRRCAGREAHGLLR